MKNHNQARFPVVILCAFLFCVVFAWVAEPAPKSKGARGKSKEEAFDPSKIDIDKVKSDEEFAALLSAYRMRFIGGIKPEMEMSFPEIIRDYRDGVETKMMSGTRRDDKKVEMSFTGIQLRRLFDGKKLSQEAKTLVVYGNDRYAAVVPVKAVLDGEVYLVWRRDGKYLAPGEDGVTKIVWNGGATSTWVKNPVIFDFVAGFLDKVPQADKLKGGDQNFIDQQSLFTLSIGGEPSIDSASWSLAIGGLVGKPVTLGYGDVLNLPRSSVFATLETISNPPGGRLIGNAVWTGVLMAAVFELVKPKTGVREVVFRCADGYSTSLTLDELRGEGVMLAYQVNGEPLDRRQGYPLRLVAPEKYGMKWAKWITQLEFVDYDYKGYWESRGWSDYAGRDRPDKRYD
jgi:DMSO/TMAO reductase YedYZ molybdopterin-dependent catalytic subunit